MRIEVYRGAGDRQGVQVSDSLLNGEASLIERGRAELNERAHTRRTQSLTIVPRPGLRQGLLVRRVAAGKPPMIGRIVSLSWQRESGESAEIGVQVDLEFPL